PALLVATYFAEPVESLPALASTDIESIALDLTRGARAETARGIPGLGEKSLILGAVDGRNVWRTDLRTALADLEQWQGVARELSVATSCPLLHVPYDVSRETGLDAGLQENLAFADQKLTEVVALQQALNGD